VVATTISAIVALVRDSNAIEVKRHTQIFKRYYYGKSSYIKSSYWYRDREARYIINYGTRIRKKN